MIGAWNAGATADGTGTSPASGAGAAGAVGATPAGGATAGPYCSINGTSAAAELFLLLRQRPQSNVANYIIVATSKEDAAAASAVPGTELVSRHGSYGDAVAAARRACPNPVQGSF
jgi:hypothetical protein